MATGVRKLMRSVTGGSSTSTGGSNAPVIATFATAVLSASAVEAGTLLMAKGFIVTNVTVNAGARVRLYATEGGQLNDTGVITGGVPSANRPRTQPPIAGTQHNVIFDLYLNTPDKFTWDMSPVAPGCSMDSPQTSTLYYAVDNISGVAQSIVVTVTYVPDES